MPQFLKFKTDESDAALATARLDDPAMALSGDALQGAVAAQIHGLREWESRRRLWTALFIAPLVVFQFATTFLVLLFSLTHYLVGIAACSAYLALVVSSLIAMNRSTGRVNRCWLNLQRLLESVNDSVALRGYLDAVAPRADTIRLPSRRAVRLSVLETLTRLLQRADPDSLRKLEPKYHAALASLARRDGHDLSLRAAAIVALADIGAPLLSESLSRPHFLRLIVSLKGASRQPARRAAIAEAARLFLQTNLSTRASRSDGPNGDGPDRDDTPDLDL